jgi:hypothetical protein
VFNVNIYPKSASKKEEATANDAVIQIQGRILHLQDAWQQTPAIKTFLSFQAPVKDMKIEEVKLTMVVKDDKTNSIQSIQGNWKPANSVAQ